MTWSDLSDLKWKDMKKASHLKWRDVKRAVSGMDREDVLHRLGLEEHTPTADFFTGLGLFAVGVLVGAGLGLMFAPKPGAEIRSRIGETIRNRGGRSVEELGQRFGGEPTSPGTHIS